MPEEQLRPRASPCPQPGHLLVGHVTPAVVVHVLRLQCLQPLPADSPVVTLQTRDVVCDKEIHGRGQPSAAAQSFCAPLPARDHGGDICGENAGGGCHSAHLAIVVTSAPGGGMYHPGLCLSRAGEVRSLGGGLQQQADPLPAPHPHLISTHPQHRVCTCTEKPGCFADSQLSPPCTPVLPAPEGLLRSFSPPTLGNSWSPLSWVPPERLHPLCLGLPPCRAWVGRVGSVWSPSSGKGPLSAVATSPLAGFCPLQAPPTPQGHGNLCRCFAGAPLCPTCPLPSHKWLFQSQRHLGT